MHVRECLSERNQSFTRTDGRKARPVKEDPLTWLRSTSPWPDLVGSLTALPRTRAESVVVPSASSASLASTTSSNQEESFFDDEEALEMGSLPSQGESTADPLVSYYFCQSSFDMKQCYNFWGSLSLER